MERLYAWKTKLEPKSCCITVATSGRATGAITKKVSCHKNYYIKISQKNRDQNQQYLEFMHLYGTVLSKRLISLTYFLIDKKKVLLS